MPSAARKLSTPVLALNPQLAELLGEKIRVLFESTFDIDTNVGQFRIESVHEPKGDIYACLKMVQKEVEGTFIISFTEGLAIDLVSNVYRQKISEVNDLVKDAIGEISNIVYASVKSVLNEGIGHDFQLAIPEVFLKGDLTNDTRFVGRTLIVPINIKGGTFEVFVTIKR